MLALLLVVGGLARPANAGPLITDGTFSQTSLTSGGYICVNSGSTCTSNLTYWTATCSQSSCNGTSTPGSILFAGTNGDVTVSAWNGNNGLYPTVLNPPGGGNVIAIDGDPNYSNTISQVITGLAVGDRYAVTFYQGAAQQEGLSGATTETWKVTLGSATDYSTTMNNASKGVVAWNSQTLDFIATANSETLTFLALGTPSGEPPVDLLADVSMSDIPEPTSLAVLGGGLLMLLVARRRTNAA